LTTAAAGMSSREPVTLDGFTASGLIAVKLSAVTLLFAKHKQQRSCYNCCTAIMEGHQSNYRSYHVTDADDLTDKMWLLGLMNTEVAYPITI
jgi:hypothetical protein